MLEKVKNIIEKEYGKIEGLGIISIKDNQITVKYLDCGYYFIDTITL